MAKQPMRWKRRILLPIWLVRICAMLAICVIFAFALAYVKSSGVKPAIGVVVFFFLLIVAVLLLDVLQILMLLQNNLTPMAMLIISSVQAGFWGGVLLMNIVYIAREGDNASGVVTSLALFILFLATFIYAIIIFIRQRKETRRGQYAPAANPAMPSMTPTPYTGPAVQHYNTEYPSSVYAGGDLGQQHIPYSTFPSQADYSAEPPAKPAHMV